MKTASENGTSIVKLLHDSDVGTLGRLLNSKAKVAMDEEHIWVRYPSDDEHAAGVASCLNGRHFRLLDDSLLIPLGATVATERLPRLEWQKFSNAIEFKLPMAALSGRLAAVELPECKLPELKLLRGGVERPASAGLFALDNFSSWVDTAPQFRLQRLSACMSDRDVLVIGNPLPPIDCEFLCQEGRLLTPAGMTWYPHINAEQVLEHFDVAANQMLLWTRTDEWSSIPLALIKPLQRGSVRAYVSKQ